MPLLTALIRSVKRYINNEYYYYYYIIGDGSDEN